MEIKKALLLDEIIIRLLVAFQDIELDTASDSDFPKLGISEELFIEDMEASITIDDLLAVLATVII